MTTETQEQPSRLGQAAQEQPSPLTLQQEQIRRYLKLRRAKTHHEEAAKTASSEMKELEADILMLLAELGAGKKGRITIDGCTLFVKRTFYPKAAQGVDKLVLAKALRRAPTWRFIVGWSYNASKLRSRILELRDSGKPGSLDKDGLPILPPSLRALVDLGEKVELGVSSPTK